MLPTLKSIFQRHYVPPEIWEPLLPNACEYSVPGMNPLAPVQGVSSISSQNLPKLALFDVSLHYNVNSTYRLESLIELLAAGFVCIVETACDFPTCKFDRYSTITYLLYLLAFNGQQEVYASVLASIT